MAKTGKSHIQSLHDLITDFNQAFGDTMDAVRNQGRIYRRVLDLYGEEGAEKLREQKKMYTRYDWALLLAIGQGTALPELMFLPTGLSKILKTLSIPDQARLVVRGVDLAKPEGGYDNMSLHTLNRKMRDQVFDYTCCKVRSIPEQLSWIEANKESSEETTPPLPYYVDPTDGAIVIPKVGIRWYIDDTLRLLDMQRAVLETLAGGDRRRGSRR